MMLLDAPLRIRDLGRLENLYAHTYVHAHVDFTRETRKKKYRESRAECDSLFLLSFFQNYFKNNNDHQVSNAEVRTQRRRPLVSMKTRQKTREARSRCHCARPRHDIVYERSRARSRRAVPEPASLPMLGQIASRTASTATTTTTISLATHGSRF